MKILFITHTIDDAGLLATPGIADQIAELEKMGVRVEIWKVRVSNKLSYLKTAWKVFCLNFQTTKYDLIHATYSLNGFLARLQFKNPVIVTLMGSDLLSREPFYRQGGRDTLAGKIISRCADRVIVQTEEMAKAVSVNQESVHVIPYGVNKSIFHPAAYEEARRELGLPMDEKCILFPYNPQREEKDYPLAEQAVRLLNQKESVRLVSVYGQSRETLAKFMNACDAMVLTSKYEGSPVAVREALGCNLPVVSVRAGDVPEVLSDIEGCYLCERNPRDIADGLEKVLQRGTRIDNREKIDALDAKWSAQQVLQIYRAVLRG